MPGNPSNTTQITVIAWAHGSDSIGFRSNSWTGGTAGAMENRRWNVSYGAQWTPNDVSYGENNAVAFRKRFDYTLCH